MFLEIVFDREVNSDGGSRWANDELTEILSFFVILKVGFKPGEKVWKLFITIWYLKSKHSWRFATKRLKLTAISLV